MRVIQRVHKPGKAEADPIRGRYETTINGKPYIVEYEPGSELRDTEQVSLLEDDGIEAFFRREVLPYAPDAWYEVKSVQIGYEISFNRYFYKPQPLAFACGDQSGHSRLGEGNSRIIARDYFLTIYMEWQTW